MNELQQGIVRTKCREIMGRSGYLNNLAGLEVLEKLWGEKEDRVESGRKGGRDEPGLGGPFKWTMFMEGEGEYIMV